MIRSLVLFVVEGRELSDFIQVWYCK